MKVSDQINKCACGQWPVRIFNHHCQKLECLFCGSKTQTFSLSREVEMIKEWIEGNR